MYPMKSRENAVKKTGTGPLQQQLANAFRSNPHDPRCLVRLIQSLNQSGSYVRANNLLKKIITSIDPSSTQAKSLRDTAIKCAKRTCVNLAIRELDAHRTQQAMQVFSNLAKMMNAQGISDSQIESELGKFTWDATDTIRLQATTHQWLLTALLKRNEILQAVILLGRKDCFVSYPLAVNIMQGFARSNDCSNTPNIKKYIGMLGRLLTILGIQENKKAIISNSIYSNTHYPLNPWREKILSHYRLDEMKKWVDVSGMDILQQCVDEGRGIILLSSHMSTGRLLNMLLDRMEYKITSLEVRDRMGKYGVQSSGNMCVLEVGEKVDFPLRELYQIQKSLKKGELVNLSGDGYRGTSGIEVKFLGRKREFKTSFAELAVKTDAIVLPVFGSANPSGKIYLKIRPPLTTGDKHISHAERVAFLVRQYAALLEEVWRKKPGDIAWEQIRHYFTLPAIDNIREEN